jgi:hypothetical protein
MLRAMLVKYRSPRGRYRQVPDQVPEMFMIQSSDYGSSYLNKFLLRVVRVIFLQLAQCKTGQHQTALIEQLLPQLSWRYE